MGSRATRQDVRSSRRVLRSDGMLRVPGGVPGGKPADPLTLRSSVSSRFVYLLSSSHHSFPYKALITSFPLACLPSIAAAESSV
jgi:hypothetical protein